MNCNALEQKYVYWVPLFNIVLLISTTTNLAHTARATASPNCHCHRHIHQYHYHQPARANTARAIVTTSPPHRLIGKMSAQVVPLLHHQQQDHLSLCFYILWESSRKSHKGRILLDWDILSRGLTSQSKAEIQAPARLISRQRLSEEEKHEIFLEWAHLFSHLDMSGCWSFQRRSRSCSCFGPTGSSQSIGRTF